MMMTIMMMMIIIIIIIVVLLFLNLPTMEFFKKMNNQLDVKY